MQLVLVSGLSGSGKSIALHVLEDAGCYCVDNLPATLLLEVVDFLDDAGHDRAAILRLIAGHGVRLAARAVRQHDNLGANVDPAVQIDDILVQLRMQPLETCVPIVSGALVP